MLVPVPRMKKKDGNLEKKILFNYLKNDGIPLNTEGRSNWQEI